MPEPIRLLDEHGTRHASEEWDPWIQDLDTGPDGDGALAALYVDMVVVRRIDTEATALQRQGELALWPPLLGQEAAQIGSGRALRADDFVFSSYRENAVAYCRGVGILDLVRVWRGLTASAWNPFDVGMAAPQVIIGAQTLHATGYALAIQADLERDGAEREGRGTDQKPADSAVAVAYFGDGAMSEGDVGEAFVFASTFQAPVVFFCQNNQYAISEPVRVQTRVPLVDRPGGYGIPAVQVDGNDVLAVMAVTRQALDRARTGGGPSFIEAVTYRMGPHTTADDPTRYRDPAELEVWGARDPIARLRTHLEQRGASGPELEARAAAAADSVARELRAGISGLEDPPALDLFAHVYAEPHPGVDRQRDEYARYLEGFAL